MAIIRKYDIQSRTKCLKLGIILSLCDKYGWYCGNDDDDDGCDDAYGQCTAHLGTGLRPRKSSLLF